jgi:Kelch motif
MHPSVLTPLTPLAHLTAYTVHIAYTALNSPPVDTRTWIIVQTEGAPALFGHCSAVVGASLFIFGGITSNFKPSNKLYEYSFGMCGMSDCIVRSGSNAKRTSGKHCFSSPPFSRLVSLSSGFRVVLRCMHILAGVRV